MKNCLIMASQLTVGSALPPKDNVIVLGHSFVRRLHSFCQTSPRARRKVSQLILD